MSSDRSEAAPWSLADAKNRLSELLDRARQEGPQTIRRQEDVFVILPQDQYAMLSGQSPSFTDWILNSPRLDDLERPRRSNASMRDHDL